MPCLSSDSLDWALAHAERYGDTNIFPVPFEFKAIRDQWDRVRYHLANADFTTWECRPLRRCLAPKHRFGFRVCTQLDPLDWLLFTGLVYEAGGDLEGRRVPRDRRCAFAHRFAPRPDGTLFDPSVTYGDFQEATGEMLSAGSFGYVVTADIADFYPRLYLHRLENALTQATALTDHARAITRLIKQWNVNVSYGIPVGPLAACLLAELAIDDVDRTLMSEGFQHVRYVDDFRVFCEDLRGAYRALATLASFLSESHGLTLQQHKTAIMPAERFRETHLESPAAKELAAMRARFDELVEEAMGFFDPYGFVYEPDDAEQLVEIAATLNLQGLLRQEIEKDELDPSAVRFYLRRLRELDDPTVIQEILERRDALYPVFGDIIRFLESPGLIPPEARLEVGGQLSELLTDSAIGHLEYHRMWVFHLMSAEEGWVDPVKLIGFLASYPDQFSQRELLLAIGASRQDHYFRQQKSNWMSFSPWVKRALLGGSRCLPPDERRHWYRAIEARCDVLEQTVVGWARGSTP